MFGGNAGVGMFTVGYRGLVDDVVVFDHALTSDEPAQFLKIFGTARGADPIGGVGVVK